jgi:hypothetical protein
MVHFESESVDHFTTECLAQIAPEQVTHFAEKSVAGCYRTPQLYAIAGSSEA